MSHDSAVALAALVLMVVALGWAIARDPGYPEARPVPTVAVTLTPDWQAIALHNRDSALRCWATVRAYEAHDRAVYLPMVMR